jgi:hypothetical protein
MLNPVATHFVLILSAATRYGVLHRRDCRKSAIAVQVPEPGRRADGYRLLTFLAAESLGVFAT